MENLPGLGQRQSKPILGSLLLATGSVESMALFPPPELTPDCLFSPLYIMTPPPHSRIVLPKSPILNLFEPDLQAGTLQLGRLDIPSSRHHLRQASLDYSPATASHHIISILPPTSHSPTAALGLFPQQPLACMRAEKRAAKRRFCTDFSGWSRQRTHYFPDCA